MSSSKLDFAKRSDRWRTAMVKIPPDFLRVTHNNSCNNEVIFQSTGSPYMVPSHIGRLSITCVQARLARNYGITRMDPYARIRVGHYVYETQTDPNGGKNPHWNRVVQSQLAVGVNSIYIEIYDECSFKMDELIAWCEIKVPDSVLQGKTHEEWYPLNGKQGEGLEGAIDIVLSFSTQQMPQYLYHSLPTRGSLLMVPSGRPTPIFVTQPHMTQEVLQPAILSEAELTLIQEMFSNIEKDVVKSVYEANRGNKDETVNSLLQLND